MKQARKIGQRRAAVRFWLFTNLDKFGPFAVLAVALLWNWW